MRENLPVSPSQGDALSGVRSSLSTVTKAADMGSSRANPPRYSHRRVTTAAAWRQARAWLDLAYPGRVATLSADLQAMDAALAENLARLQWVAEQEAIHFESEPGAGPDAFQMALRSWEQAALDGLGALEPTTPAGCFSAMPAIAVSLWPRKPRNRRRHASDSSCLSGSLLSIEARGHDSSISRPAQSTVAWVSHWHPLGANAVEVSACSARSAGPFLRAHQRKASTMRLRPPTEDTRSIGERSLQSQMARAPRLVPNIPEPVTTRKDTLPMENENLSHQYLPPTPGELALAAAMASAPNLGPADPAAAERAYQANVAWASDYTQVFANAGLGMEICAGGVKVKCRSCDRAKLIATGTDLTPAVLTCQGGCNRYAADPDAGLSRTGVRP